MFKRRAVAIALLASLFVACGNDSAVVQPTDKQTNAVICTLGR